MDVDAGRVVKGTRFIDIRDAGDPVELAAHYDATGADELVFLDITATSDKRSTVVELARRAADEVFVPFTIGGGVRELTDAQAVLDAGADKVSVNSAAVARPQLVSELADVLGRPVHDVDHRVASVAGGRDVEEHELVGPLGVVALGELDRVAGVADVDEVDALHDATGRDVEARDDPRDAHQPARRVAATASSIVNSRS